MRPVFANLLTLFCALALAACGTTPAARVCIDTAGCDPGQSCENSICVAPETDTTADTDEDGGDDTVEDTADTTPDILPDTLDTDTVADVEDTRPDTVDPNCQQPEVGFYANGFNGPLTDTLVIERGGFFTAVAQDENGIPVPLLRTSVWYLDGPIPFAFDGPSNNPLSVQLDDAATWRLTLSWNLPGGCNGTLDTLRVIVTDPTPVPPIRVTLRWSPEPAGTTTDFDLHMTRVTDGSATWSDANDCYYRNTAPDWGTAGSANNPLFSGDDRGTPGIEVITLTEAADPDYLVGINLYRDIGAPGAEATVIIETPTLTYTNSRTLSGTGEVWYPAAIRRYAPDTYELVELNTTSAGFTGITLP